MTKKQILSRGIIPMAALLTLSACAKNSAPPADASTETPPAEAAAQPAPLAEPKEESSQMFVEGVAGGVMTSTLVLEAEVVSVDQEKREAVLRGPDGNESVVRVGKGAVNFYQIKAGDRVKVAMARELLIYVEEEGVSNSDSDGTAVVAAGAQEGEQPAGAIVSSSRVTAKITNLDAEARKATVVFEDGKEETYDVRPDVEMDNYKVGQEVVFLVTELLAVEVETL